MYERPPLGKSFLAVRQADQVRSRGALTAVPEGVRGRFRSFARAVWC